jgi:hypothetical protein
MVRYRYNQQYTPPAPFIHEWISVSVHFCFEPWEADHATAPVERRENIQK